jgi:NADH-quinone oxidoreductase subunit M
MFPILSWLVFLPLVGALLILCLPKDKGGVIKSVALGATGVVLLLSMCLLSRFDFSHPQMQFVEQVVWIAPMNIWYFLGVDGLSVTMIFLTGLLGFIACIASLGIDDRPKEYFVFYLLLMTGMMGTFLALDLFLFYIFWEVVLIPMYFLIGIWGGPRRQYAAIKFFLYTLAGSVLMLIGILVAYFTTNPHTFNMLELVKASAAFDFRLQIWLFLAFYFAFAIKVPVFPFHTWLPDAHVEAPTPISVILAGVLLKLGAYGLFRICYPMFPQAAMYFAFPLAVLGVINIVYGASVAMAQTDFKKMIAYSSVSHMGFVILGLASFNATGFNGALLEMFNHGIITGAMFLLVGVLYDRAHTRDLGKFGGLSGHMPVYAFFLTLCSLASLGLPGLSGFVGEFLALIGAFPVYQTITIISTVGLIIVVAFFLYMLQRVLMGPLNPSCAGYPDMTPREILTLVPLAIIIVVAGVYPAVVLNYQEAAVRALVSLF